MTKRLFFVSLLVALSAVIAVTEVAAQRRDSMTDEEIELVRNNQDIDKRIDVLTKMIDRRFTAMGMDVGGWKQTDKDQELWGETRTGTRAQLLLDVRQLLQKAIDDIDDVVMHNENTLTQNKTEGLLFPQAVRSLAAAATRYLPALKATLEKVTDERDKGLVLGSIEHCEDIIEAVKKLPPDTKPAKKGKS
jgi:hypothetical protein